MGRLKANNKLQDVAPLQEVAASVIDKSLYGRLYEEITYLERYRDDFFRQKLKLSSAEWRILLNIAALEPVSTNRLSMHTSLDRATTSRAAASLANKGLTNHVVDRNDRRLVSITLTNEGQRASEFIIHTVEGWEERLRKAITPQRVALLRAIPDQLFAHYKELAEGASEPLEGEDGTNADSARQQSVPNGRRMGGRV